MSDLQQDEFSASVVEVDKEWIHEYTISRGGVPLAYSGFLDSLRSSPRFRSYFNDLLASSPFPAFRWETPSLSDQSKALGFRFAIVNSPGLEGPPDMESFREYLFPSDDIAVFPNLGRDATLVIPTMPGDHSGYGHLATFVREAPNHVRDAFWRSVGIETSKRISDAPIWLSTAGGGVAWLHMRIDNRPKYYAYAKYKTP